MLPGITSTLFGGRAQVYEIARSLRFHHQDANYLNRTPSVTGERRAWTFSCWAKRTLLGNATTNSLYLFESYIDTSNYTIIYFHNVALDTFSVIHLTGGTTRMQKRTTAVMRDPTAWFHLCVAADTRPATPTCDIYVNGILATSFIANIVPAQNETYHFSEAGTINYFGIHGGSTAIAMACYLAETNFIDGQALPATTFAELDAATGLWRPKKYTGSYGTNGFYLPFSNNASAAALGADYSGNGNNFTVNGISVTAGSTNDSVFDSPADYVDANGDIHSNYCILNSIDTMATSMITLRQGNMEAVNATAATWACVRGTMWVNAGKWYWESTPLAGADTLYMFGVLGRSTYLAGRTAGFFHGQVADGYAYYNAATGGGATTRTYVLSNEAGDVSGATLGCKKLVTTAPVTGTILNVTPTQAQPQTLYAVTAAGDPGASYANGIITVEFLITGGDGDPFQLSARAHRVSGTTIATSGTLSAIQNQTGAGTFTFSLPSESLGTWGASDRLLIEYRVSVQTGQNDAIVHMGLGTASNETTINMIAGTQTGQKYNNSAMLGYGNPFSINDVIGTALDLDAGTLTFYKNGVSQGVAYTGLTGFFAPAVSVYQPSSTAAVAAVNFGQRPFAQLPPLGHKALCSYNMPATAPALPASFVGNALADGPFVWAGGVVNTVTINGNVAVRGTDFDSDAGGMKLRTASASFNAAGTNTITAATYGLSVKYSRAQPNN